MSGPRQANGRAGSESTGVTHIHPTAVVSPRAALGREVSVGPFVVIEADAVIGDRCRLEARAVVKDGATLGSDNFVGEGAVVGGAPQHVRAPARQGRLRIGNGNTIRENATLHRALAEGHETVVGDGNYLMVAAHVGHDCRVGNHTILVNNVLLGGHVLVEDRAYLSGAVAVHQFCRIGRNAMIGGPARIVQDVPPFVTVDGQTGKVVGLNVVGLRRSGMSRDEIASLKEAYRLLYRGSLAWSETLSALAERFPDGPAAHFHAFLSGSKRGIVQERRGPRGATLRLAGDIADADASDDAVGHSRKVG
jgi:UDP-N-acetylglucosamine acyltransferase